MEQSVGTLRNKARAAWVAQRQNSAPRTLVPTAGWGLFAGTRVVTPGGWAAVESLHRGDEVLTFDAGFQRLTAVVKSTTLASHHLDTTGDLPVLVPAGTIENRQDLLVPAKQGVLVESATVRDKWGDPYAMIPAAALGTLDGVSRVDTSEAKQHFYPVFSEDQMVFANGGTLVFSHCVWGLHAGIRPRFGRSANYDMLSMSAAIALLRSGSVRSVSVSQRTEALAA